MSTHQPSRQPRRLRRALLALAAVLAICAAACGDDADSTFQEVDAAISGSGPSDSDTGDALAQVGDDGADGGDGGGSGDDGTAEPNESFDTSGDADFGFDVDATARQTVQEEPGDEVPNDALATALFVGRDIIRTGEVVLESPDVEETTDDVIDAVFRSGGAIWGQDSTTEGTPRSVLTVRVPPAQFDAVMEAIQSFDGVEGVGVVSTASSTDDVTEVVLDLDARITAAESSVARVQQLLDDATDLNRVFELESELITRQADLERLLGQRKTIGDRIALSTITVTIIEADPDRLESGMEIVAWLGESADVACPGQSDISIGADGSAVLCVSISNTGDDVLTDVDVTVPRLRLRVDDFTVAAGDATIESIAPGDELTLTAMLEADDGFIRRVDASDGLQIGVDVTAVPATSTAAELSRQDSVFISADVDDPLPGFGDAFSDGWGAMTFVVSLLMIAIGALLPFVPFILLAWWIGRKITAASRRRADERAAFVQAYAASQQAAAAATDPPPAGD